MIKNEENNEKLKGKKLPLLRVTKSEAHPSPQEHISFISDY